MSKSDSYRLATGGWYDDSEGSHDPGYRSLEIWTKGSHGWSVVWESCHVDGDDLNGTSDIRKDLLEALPKFGLTPEDIIYFGVDCVYDWTIR